MKYNFKANQVMNEIEHSLRRYMDEVMPGYGLMVDLTSDPRSFVAAMFLDRCFEEQAHVVYVEDKANDNVSDDVIDMVSRKYKDRFHKIASEDCEIYRICLDAFIQENPVQQLSTNADIKFLYETSKFPGYIFCGYTDNMQNVMGYGPAFGDTRIPIFDSLVCNEIFMIGDKLGIDIDLLNNLYEKSDLIRTHEEVLNFSIREISQTYRENGKISDEVADSIRKYGRNITSTANLPVLVQTTSLYDL